MKEFTMEDRHIKQIEQLKIEPNDLIVFRLPTTKMTNSIKEGIKKISEHVSKFDAKIVFVDKEIEVEKFNEYQMNKLGWYKKDANTKRNS
jgi:hypothetical protein